MCWKSVDCDPGDKQYITNATALQSKSLENQALTFVKPVLVDTAAYVGQICAMKNCSAFVHSHLPQLRMISDSWQLSVGDNFYDSGVDFSTAGILRFQAAWADMYTQGVFKYAPW